MSEHSELLNEARSQATELVGCVMQVYSPPKRSMWKAYITTLRELADTVEQQDKIIADHAAAGVTCDEAIATVLPYLDYVHKAHATRLRSTRHLVVEPKDDHVEATLAEATAKYNDLLKRLGNTTNLPEPPSNPQLREWARRSDNQPPQEWWDATDDPFTLEEPASLVDWDRYHKLLDIMAEKGGLLSPEEQAEYNRFLPIIKQLDAEEGRAADAALDNLVKEHERVIASIRRLASRLIGNC